MSLLLNMFMYSGGTTLYYNHVYNTLRGDKLIIMLSLTRQCTEKKQLFIYLLTNVLSEILN